MLCGHGDVQVWRNIQGQFFLTGILPDDFYFFCFFGVVFLVFFLLFFSFACPAWRHTIFLDMLGVKSK